MPPCLGGDRGFESPLGRICYFFVDIFPVLAPQYLTIPPRPNRKLQPSVRSGLTERHRTQSLRSLANHYGVSYEAVRRTLAVTLKDSTPSPCHQQQVLLLAFQTFLYLLYSLFNNNLSHIGIVNRQRKWHSFRVEINGHIRDFKERDQIIKICCYITSVSVEEATKMDNRTGGLRTLRHEKMLTQQDLAARADLTIATISGIETGKFNPSFRTIRALAKGPWL